MGKIPTVVEGLLTEGGNVIAVDSPQWIEWLKQHSSFRFEPLPPQAGFTVRVEKSGYWYGYRKQQGKLHKRYIGKLSELTTERLEEIAVLLNEPQQPREKKVTQKVTQNLYVTASANNYATNEDVAQLWGALGALRQEVAALGKLKAR